MVLVFPSDTNAGGGLVEMYGFQEPHDGYAKPGEQITFRIKANIKEGGRCQKCPIKVKFIHPQSSDIINQSSDLTDDNGEIYAKAISNIPYIRYVYADVTMPDGSVYTSSRALVNFAGRIIFYPESEDSAVNVSESFQAPAITVQGPGSMPKPTTMVLRSTTPELPKVKPTSIPAPEEEIKIEPSATSDTRAEDLNKRVEQLEQQLDESKQEQQKLENNFNNLISWIKSIFPFFKQ